MKFFSFLTGFFQDQRGNSSRKALTLYIFVFFFGMEVNANINGVKIDTEILFATVGVILFSIGAVTAEYFNDHKKVK